jgi:hypothetical protein
MRTTIYLGAAPGHHWPIDLDTAEVQLRRRWPEIVVRRLDSHVTGKQRLSCDVIVDDQPMPLIYEADGPLVLEDGDPAVWADTIAWWLSLLPAGTPTVTMTDANTNPVAIETTSDAAQVRELLDRLNAQG